jgi:urease accessory protein
MLSRIVAFALLLSPTAAQAHHVMGGVTPQTFGQGLLSGLAHPVIGLDHFAFVAAAGILAAPLARGAVMPLLFLAGGAVGAALHLAGLDLPGSEVAIALSVVALGGLVVLRRSAPAPVLAALFALAGVFHGYALTESIVGAEPAPLSAYLAGLVAVQYAVSLAALYGTRWLTAERPALAPAAFVAAGAALLAVGLTLLLGAALA